MNEYSKSSNSVDSEGYHSFHDEYCKEIRRSTLLSLSNIAEKYKCRANNTPFNNKYKKHIDESERRKQELLNCFSNVSKENKPIRTTFNCRSKYSKCNALPEIVERICDEDENFPVVQEPNEEESIPVQELDRVCLYKSVENLTLNYFNKNKIEKGKCRILNEKRESNIKYKNKTNENIEESIVQKDERENLVNHLNSEKSMHQIVKPMKNDGKNFKNINNSDSQQILATLKHKPNKTQSEISTISINSKIQYDGRPSPPVTRSKSLVNKSLKHYSDLSELKFQNSKSSVNSRAFILEDKYSGHSLNNSKSFIQKENVYSETPYSVDEERLVKVNALKTSKFMQNKKRELASTPNKGHNKPKKIKFKGTLSCSDSSGIPKVVNIQKSQNPKILTQNFDHQSIEIVKETENINPLISFRNILDDKDGIQPSKPMESKNITVCKFNSQNKGTYTHLTNNNLIYSQESSSVHPSENLLTEKEVSDQKNSSNYVTKINWCEAEPSKKYLVLFKDLSIRISSLTDDDDILFYKPIDEINLTNKNVENLAAHNENISKEPSILNLQGDKLDVPTNSKTPKLSTEKHVCQKIKKLIPQRTISNVTKIVDLQNNFSVERNKNSETYDNTSDEHVSKVVSLKAKNKRDTCKSATVNVASDTAYNENTSEELSILNLRGDKLDVPANSKNPELSTEKHVYQKIQKSIPQRTISNVTKIVDLQNNFSVEGNKNSETYDNTSDEHVSKVVSLKAKNKRDTYKSATVNVASDTAYNENTSEELSTLNLRGDKLDVPANSKNPKLSTEKRVYQKIQKSIPQRTISNVTKIVDLQNKFSVEGNKNSETYDNTSDDVAKVVSLKAKNKRDTCKSATVSVASDTACNRNTSEELSILNLRGDKLDVPANSKNPKSSTTKYVCQKIQKLIPQCTISNVTKIVDFQNHFSVEGNKNSENYDNSSDEDVSKVVSIQAKNKCDTSKFSTVNAASINSNYHISGKTQESFQSIVSNDRDITNTSDREENGTFTINSLACINFDSVEYLTIPSNDKEFENISNIAADASVSFSCFNKLNNTLKKKLNKTCYSKEFSNNALLNYSLSFMKSHQHFISGYTRSSQINVTESKSSMVNSSGLNEKLASKPLLKLRKMLSRSQF